MPSSIPVDEILARLLQLEHVKVPEGEVYDSKIKVSPAKLIHINFVDPKRSKNIPNDDVDTLIEYPYKQARKLVIQNRGPAILRWQYNAKPGSTTAMNRLTPNEGDNDDWYGFPLIRSLNLIAEGAPYSIVEYSLRV